MVVIDAEKHKLDYHQSEIDNDIAMLKRRYQGRWEEGEDGERVYREGASTLISRSKGETQVLKRKGSPRTDPVTGELVWKEVREEYIDPKTGKTKLRTQKSTQMAETRDARTLSSGTRQEEAYAAYANDLKAMANQARKAILETGKIEYKASAKEVYRPEVDSLLAKLNVALLNAPREREAQRIANSVVKAKKNANPDMTHKEIRKAGQQALTKARLDVGAKRTPIFITDKEWEAIQSGAISENILQKIIRNTDIDRLRQLATPRSASGLSAAKQARISSMKVSGYTTAEIARAIGVSASTVSNYLNSN
jgi:DNA-binding CsgD family transcriptional regulator